MFDSKEADFGNHRLFPLLPSHTVTVAAVTAPSGRTQQENYNKNDMDDFVVFSNGFGRAAAEPSQAAGFLF